MPRTTICWMQPEERFAAVQPYIGRDVIVRASQIRRQDAAENYPGRVLSVAYGIAGAADVLVLILSGPKGAGMPPVSINLAMILTILPDTAEEESPDA